MLCRLQLFHQPYEHILSQGKILDVRIFIYRRSSHTFQVIRQSGRTAVQSLKFLPHILILVQIGSCFGSGCCQTSGQSFGLKLHLYENV